MAVNWYFYRLSATLFKSESHANIESEKGILNRQIRSIQTEGHFSDMKENENFRRFNYRSSDRNFHIVVELLNRKHLPLTCFP